MKLNIDILLKILHKFSTEINNIVYEWGNQNRNLIEGLERGTLSTDHMILFKKNP